MSYPGYWRLLACPYPIQVSQCANNCCISGTLKSLKSVFFTSTAPCGRPNKFTQMILQVVIGHIQLAQLIYSICVKGQCQFSYQTKFRLDSQVNESCQANKTIDWTQSFELQKQREGIQILRDRKGIAASFSSHFSVPTLVCLHLIALSPFLTPHNCLYHIWKTERFLALNPCC